MSTDEGTARPRGWEWNEPPIAQPFASAWRIAR